MGDEEQVEPQGRDRRVRSIWRRVERSELWCIGSLRSIAVTGVVFSCSRIATHVIVQMLFHKNRVAQNPVRAARGMKMEYSEMGMRSLLMSAQRRMV